MVNRMILILLILSQVTVLNAQPYEENGDTVFEDLMDQSRVFKTIGLTADGNDIDVFYYDIQDTANLSVKFKGGSDCFQQYFDSCYYSYIDIENMAYKEFNTYITCVLLFDSNLFIRDVRILDVYHYSYLLKPYYGRIKKILLSTEGRWYRVNNRRKWSFFLFPIRIRLLRE